MIGPHRLLAGDLTAGAVAAVMGSDLADVIYTDPPWGPALLQTFATLHEKGSVPRLPWAAFLAELAMQISLAIAPRAPVFVEMGLRWVDELDAAMDAVGLPPRRRWAVTYGAKNHPLPSAVSLYGERDVRVDLPVPPHGEPVTRAILGAVVRPGMVVLDPCTGLGMTARATHLLGGSFRGVELTAARLERTAAWLRRRIANPGFWTEEDARRAARG